MLSIWHRMAPEFDYTAHLSRNAGDMPTARELGHGVQAKARILHHATTMFADRGFHGVTIRDLAARAGVNLAAVNYHFRSKDDLYGAVIDAALSRWSLDVLAPETVNRHDSLERLLHAIIAALVDPPADRADGHVVLRLLAWSLLERTKPLARVRVQVFAAGLAQVFVPVLPKRVDPRTAILLAQWLLGQCLLISPMLNQFETDGHQQREDLIDTCVKLALEGLSAVAERG